MCRVTLLGSATLQVMMSGDHPGSRGSDYGRPWGAGGRREQEREREREGEGRGRGRARDRDNAPRTILKKQDTHSRTAASPKTSS